MGPKVDVTGRCMAHGEAQFLCMNAKTEAECAHKHGSLCYWKNATSAPTQDMSKVEATGRCMAHGEAQFLCMNVKTEAGCAHKHGSLCYWKNATSASTEVPHEIPKVDATTPLYVDQSPSVIMI